MNWCDAVHDPAKTRHKNQRRVLWKMSGLQGAQPGSRALLHRLPPSQTMARLTTLLSCLFLCLSRIHCLALPTAAESQPSMNVNDREG